ncbi:uncharacterized protein [Nerophis lumbriciformis]
MLEPTFTHQFIVDHKSCLSPGEEMAEEVIRQVGTLLHPLRTWDWRGRHNKTPAVQRGAWPAGLPRNGVCQDRPRRQRQVPAAAKIGLPVQTAPQTPGQAWAAHSRASRTRFGQVHTGPDPTRRAGRTRGERRRRRRSRGAGSRSCPVDGAVPAGV